MKSNRLQRIKTRNNRYRLFRERADRSYDQQTKADTSYSTFVFPLGQSSARDPRGGAYRPGLETYGTNSESFAIFNKVAEFAASVAWTAVSPKSERKGEGAYSQKNRETRDGTLIDVRRSHLDEYLNTGEYEQSSNSRILDVWNNGNKYLSGYDVRLTTILNLLLAGVVHLVWEKDQANRPASLYPVPAQNVERIGTTKRYRFKLDSSYSTPHTIEAGPGEYLTFRVPHPADPYCSNISLAQVLSDELSIAESASRLALQRFEEGIIPGFLTFESETDKQSREMVRNEFSQYRRSGDAFALPILGHNMKYHAIGQTATDLGYIETKKDARDTMRAVVGGLPPELIGEVSNSNLATSRVAIALAHLSVSLPILRRLCDYLYRLRPAFGTDDILTFKSPVPTDYQRLYEAVKIGKSAFTRDELRQAAGLPKLGNEYGNSFLAEGETESEESEEENESEGNEENEETQSDAEEGDN